jgi:hypothetical protein
MVCKIAPLYRLSGGSHINSFFFESKYKFLYWLHFQILSSWSSCSIEEVSSSASGLRFFQLSVCSSYSSLRSYLFPCSIWSRRSTGAVAFPVYRHCHI